MIVLAKPKKRKRKLSRKAKGRRISLLISTVMVLIVIAGALYLPAKQAFQRWRYPLEYGLIVAEWAREYEVDECLIYATMRTESGFDPLAESNVGARGLMQMTEETFDWLKSKIAADEDITFDDLYSPNTAVRFGVYFISLCLDRYGGDIATAAAAYHSGWGTVDSLLEQAEYSYDGVTLQEFPYSQMRHYVYKITTSHTQYKDLYAEKGWYINEQG